MVAIYTVPDLVGTPPTFTAPTTTDTVEIGSTLIVKNGSGASITVTFITPGNLVTGDTFPDKAYTIAAAAERWMPVLPAYRNGTTGLADITISAVTSVTAAAIRPSSYVG